MGIARSTYYHERVQRWVMRSSSAVVILGSPNTVAHWPKARLEAIITEVDFSQFRVSFTAEPGVMHIVWLFSIVLGRSRLIWGRFAHR